jgi:hypothetical protein
MPQEGKGVQEPSFAIILQGRLESGKEAIGWPDFEGSDRVPRILEGGQFHGAAGKSTGAPQGVRSPCDGLVVRHCILPSGGAPVKRGDLGASPSLAAVLYVYENIRSTRSSND